MTVNLQEFNINTFKYTFQIFKSLQDKIPQMTTEDKIYIAVEILKKFGTKELSYIQRELRLSASVYSTIMKNPEIIHNRVEKTPVETPSHELYGDLPAKAALQMFPEAKFYSYVNRVGNYKDVTLVEAQDKTYVLQVFPKLPSDYQQRYEKLKDQQHRPESETYEIENEKTISKGFQEETITTRFTIRFFEFMGSETIDFRNPEHLELLVKLETAFIEQCDLIDLNDGNLVIKDGKLYYIDKDLSYVKHPNQTEAKDECLKATLSTIKNHGYPDDETEMLCKKVTDLFEKIHGNPKAE